MTSEDIYNANLDLARYKRIMDTVEILDQAEYDFCFSWDCNETRNNTQSIGEGHYLNLHLYSEVDKEAHDLRKEIGY